ADIYDSTYPTLADLGKKAQADGPKYGFKVTNMTAVLATQSDISSAVTKVLSSHPDAIDLDLAGTQNATAATEIKQGGFTGPIICEDGCGAGSLNGAGAAANGIVWASDWTAGAPFGPVSDTFTKQYKAAYAATPYNFAAEAYTTTYFIARALKAAGTTTAAKVDQAMIAEGKKGYEGVLGQHVTVVKGQMEAAPVLVQWQNGKAVAMANQNP